MVVAIFLDFTNTLEFTHSEVIEMAEFFSVCLFTYLPSNGVIICRLKKVLNNDRCHFKISRSHINTFLERKGNTS